MEALANAYGFLFTAADVVLGVLLFAVLLRCAIGPTVADRLLAVNMAGSITLLLIAVLAVQMHEGYLADIEIIYTLLSFLAVVLLTKVYMGAASEKRMHSGERKEAQKDDA